MSLRKGEKTDAYEIYSLFLFRLGRTASPPEGKMEPLGSGSISFRKKCCWKRRSKGNRIDSASYE